MTFRFVLYCGFVFIARLSSKILFTSIFVFTTIRFIRLWRNHHNFSVRIFGIRQSFFGNFASIRLCSL